MNDILRFPVDLILDVLKQRSISLRLFRKNIQKRMSYIEYFSFWYEEFLTKEQCSPASERARNHIANTFHDMGVYDKDAFIDYCKWFDEQRNSGNYKYDKKTKAFIRKDI